MLVMDTAHSHSVKQQLIQLKTLITGQMLGCLESLFFVLTVRQHKQDHCSCYVLIIIIIVIDLSLVECFEALECKNSSKSLGMMTAPECCIKNSSGLAYTKPGFKECHICIGKQDYDKLFLL